MSIDAARLREELNAGPEGQSGTPSTTYLDNCVSVANELLKGYAGENYLTDLPTVVAEKAWLAVAVEIFNQDKAPNGVLNQTFQTFEGTVATPVRIGADPLRPAYGLLERFIIGTSFA